MFRVKNTLIVLFSLFLIISCNNNNSDKSGETFSEEFQGVWQAEDWPDVENEEEYDFGIYFTNDEMTVWEYFPEEMVTDGDACFYMLSMELVSYDGDDFRFNASGFFDEGQNNDEVTVTIIVEGNTMTIHEKDNEEVKMINSRDDRAIEDLEPVCDFSTNQKTAKKEIIKPHFFM